MIISSENFARFDYFAGFVRNLEVRRLGTETFISRALHNSRPNAPLFLSLENLQLGATRDQMEMARINLNPTLGWIRLSYWEPGEPRPIQRSVPIKLFLLHVCHLEQIKVLDLLDTKHGVYEHDHEVLHALCEHLPHLKSFLSADFTTLLSVFHVLSQSANLEEVFLDPDLMLLYELFRRHSLYCADL